MGATSQQKIELTGKVRCGDCQLGEQDCKINVRAAR